MSDFSILTKTFANALTSAGIGSSSLAYYNTEDKKLSTSLLDNDAGFLTESTLGDHTTSAQVSAIVKQHDLTDLYDNTYVVGSLSSSISSKIYVNDLVDSKSYSNLSVIKIAKDDFDEYVALSSDRMSSNTLYVVDSDYIDAYGQAISNVVMSSSNLPVEATIASEAANKNYVDYIEDKLSNEINTVRKVFKDLYSKIDSITLTSNLSDIIGAVVEVKDAIKNLTAY